MDLVKTLQDHTDEIEACAFSTRCFATLSRDNSIIMYNPSFEKIKTIGIGKRPMVQSFGISSDWKYIALGELFWDDMKRNRVTVREAPQFEACATLEVPDAYTIFTSFSPDGKHLAVLSENKACLYTIPGFKLEHRTVLKDTKLAHASFSPDSSRLLIAGTTHGYGPSHAVASLHEVPSLHVIKQREDPERDSQAGACAWSPDGKYAVVVQDARTLCRDQGTLAVYAFVNDLPVMCPLKPLKDHMDPVYSVAFSSNGKYLASLSREKVIIHSMPEFEHVAGLRSRDSGGGFSDLAWSPDSSHLAITTKGQFTYRSTSTGLDPFPSCYHERVAGGASLVYQVE